MKTITLMLLALSLASETKADAPDPTAPAPTQFANGADVGWLQQMEATGYKFYDNKEKQEDCLQILKDNGINSIRLRVFVNPSADKVAGHCSAKEVTEMAVRASKMGFRIMIDLHYSDSWADPNQQRKPAAWANHSFQQLLDDVYGHTFNVLTELKSSGVVPEWVQVGNEIAYGMLWPDGSSDNWAQLDALLNKGYDAVKAVDPTTKVVIHLHNGNNGPMFRTFFDNFQKNGGKWDVIGMSYYPWWDKRDYSETIDSLGNNLKDMASRYGKEVVISEVGGDYAKPQETYDLLTAVIGKVREVPNNRGLGVFYWEPEGEKSWSGYDLSCWDAYGRPTLALTAFGQKQTGR
jgi:arabinogalactan endo-1,4-beta-galactosidase